LSLCTPIIDAFEQELINFPPISLPPHIRNALIASRAEEDSILPESTPNPAMSNHLDDFAISGNFSQNSPPNKFKLRVPMEKRYYAKASGIDWPPEVQDYNKRFTKALEAIKKRHDPTVTTVAQGVLEWKRSQNARNIGLDIQAWLDRFYLSRIGIRFLIGQRQCFLLPFPCIHNYTFSDVALNNQQAHQDYVGIICTQAVTVFSTS
jgi:pyruvate dehydrogenase kinase 2/3/4